MKRRERSSADCSGKGPFRLRGRRGGSGPTRGRTSRGEARAGGGGGNRARLRAPPARRLWGRRGGREALDADGGLARRAGPSATDPRLAARPCPARWAPDLGPGTAPQSLPSEPGPAGWGFTSSRALGPPGRAGGSRRNLAGPEPPGTRAASIEARLRPSGRPADGPGLLPQAPGLPARPRPRRAMSDVIRYSSDRS